MSDRPTTLDEIFPEPPAGLDPQALDRDAVPAHVAIIMDGNGRWAKQRGLDRGEGHKAGIRAVREAITTCNDIGVRYLTIYSFSTENWNRPKTEVTGLMDLFAKTMGAEVDGLDEEKVRIKLLGRVEDLPLATRTIFRQAEKRTAKNGGMTLAIARQLRVTSRDHGCRARNCAQGRDRRAHERGHLRGSSVVASVHGRYARP